MSINIRKLATVGIAALALTGSMVAMSGEAFAGGRGHGHGKHNGGHGHRYDHGFRHGFVYRDYAPVYAGPACYFVRGRHGRVVKVCEPFIY